MADCSPPSSRVVRFGVFEVDSRARELRKRGRRIRLQDKPFEVLCALLERPGELVTREALREKLWPANTFVDFDHGLNNAVNRLREALCDSADRPSFIETTPRRGYRFVGSVRIEAPSGGSTVQQAQPGAITIGSGNATSEPAAAVENSWTAASPIEFAGRPFRRLVHRRNGLVISIAVLMVAAVGTLWFIVSRPAGRLRIDSIAVLPLANFAAGGSEDYFADGMTEELITELAKIGSFRVISRTSVMRYKNTDRSLAEIGRELKVDALVEGTVRRSGDRVRITVQLVRAAPEQHLWADAYEGNIRDVLNLQCDVAKDIVKKVRAKVAVKKVANSRTDKRLDPETYEDYLRGRHFLARRNAEAMRRSLGYFQLAVQRDPNYAQAYAGLAMTYDLLGAYEVRPPEASFSQVKGLASKALQLDDTLSEAYTARAETESFREFDWPAAERDFQRAIALDPNSAIAHHWYGEHLINIGKAERAISELKRARELDPLSLPIDSTLGRVYRDARRYSEAVQQCKKTLELDPNFSMGHWCLGQAYVGARQYLAAIPELRVANALGTTPLLASELGYAYAAAGRTVEARAIMRALERKAQSAYVPPYLIATIHGALGEKDEAFKWLERAYAERDSHVSYLALDPEMDPLRSDPRLSALIERLKIPK